MLHRQPALFATCLALCLAFAQTALLEIWVLHPDERRGSDPVRGFKFFVQTEGRQHESWKCYNIKDLEFTDLDLPRECRVIFHARHDLAVQARLSGSNANCRVSFCYAKLAGLHLVLIVPRVKLPEREGDAVEKWLRRLHWRTCVRLPGLSTSRRD